MKLPIPEEIADTIQSYCLKHLIHPNDLFLKCLGQPSRQPFPFDPRPLRANTQQDRYIKLLHFLWSEDHERFEEAVAYYRGNKRKLFARTPEEIESTGSSNKAAPIYDSGWYAAVGMSGYAKMLRVQQILLNMGFTPDYAQMLCWYPQDGEARLDIRSEQPLPSKSALAKSEFNKVML